MFEEKFDHFYLYKFAAALFRLHDRNFLLDEESSRLTDLVEGTVTALALDQIT